MFSDVINTEHDLQSEQWATSCQLCERYDNPRAGKTIYLKTTESSVCLSERTDCRALTYSWNKVIQNGTSSDGRADEFILKKTESAEIVSLNSQHIDLTCQAASPVVFVHTDALSSRNELLDFCQPVVLSGDLGYGHNK